MTHTGIYETSACLEGQTRQVDQYRQRLCASMVAKLECHLINTQGPVTDPLLEETP